MDDTDEELFTLYGGPEDGRTTPVRRCQHHGWPNLDIAGDTSGHYIYLEDVQGYEWCPAE